MAVVKFCHEKISVPFNQDNIDRVHRVGNKYTNENTGKKIQSIIDIFLRIDKACVIFSKLFTNFPYSQITTR